MRHTGRQPHIRTIASGLVAAASATLVGFAPLTGLGLAATVSALATPTATAQSFDSDPASTILKRQTLARLMQRVTVDLTDIALEDIVSFIESTTNTDLDPLWIDDRSGTGLDPEMLISVKVRNQPALVLLEQTLEQVDRQSGFGETSWQFTRFGAFEFGPKERLNRRASLAIYDITDTLTDVPDYDNAPAFDLNTIFQQGGAQGGGGGGTSPFQNAQRQVDDRTREDRAQEIIDLIVTLVEPEQWQENGGDGGSIRFFRESLIVRAPDYVHRQLVGYSWWPARFQRVRSVNGRRYVTLNADTSIGTVDFADTISQFATTGP